MKTILFLLSGLIVCGFLGGCYVYTTNPIPSPIIVVPARVVVPTQGQPLPPPAPSGPPAGAIGPPR